MTYDPTFWKPWTILEAAHRLVGEKPTQDAWMRIQHAVQIDVDTPVLREIRTLLHYVSTGALRASRRTGSVFDAVSVTIDPRELLPFYRDAGLPLPKGFPPEGEWLEPVKEQNQ